MRNSDLLLAHLRRVPSDKTLALAAADALMEDLNVSRQHALKEVARCRLPVLRAHRQAEAVRLISRHSPRRRKLVNAMLATLGFGAGEACVIFTTHKYGPPSVGVPMDVVIYDADSMMQPGPAITVGAVWVLRKNREMLAAALARRDKARGITRFK